MASWTPGAELGHYRIVRLLGRGGMGDVYLARDLTLERDVAIKVLSAGRSDPDDARKRLLREGKAVAALDHPSICAIYEVGEAPDGSAFIVMQYVEGETLAATLLRGPMPVRDALVLGAQITEGLSAAHRRGIVHRDLKPQNIIVTSSGGLKLLDFGLAKVVLPSALSSDASTQSMETVAGIVKGTPAYMAPEQIQQRTIDGRCDLFALGAVLFECLTGHRAFDGANALEIFGQILHVHPPPVSRLRAGLDERHDALCRRLLAKDPAERFQSADEVTGALRLLTSGSAGDALPGIEPAPPDAMVKPGALQLEGAPEVAPPAAVARVRLATWLGAAGVAVIGVLGFLTSVAFDILLDRPAEFSRESVLDWWVWGFRSLVAPAFFALAAVIVVRLVSLAFHAFGRVVMPRGIATRVEALPRSAAARLGLDNPIAAGQVLLVLQAAALAWVFWHFSDLMMAFTSSISFSDPAALAPLAPQNFRHREDYRSVLPLLALGMAAAWVRVWRWRRQVGSQGDRTTMIAGASLVVILAVLAEIPYRTLNHNAFQRVTYGGERCYAIGERGTELLLYCPDSRAPRNKVVRAGDSRLERTPIVESIFTTRASASPGR
jgi:predicted Ser/Thr protein kinase